jgi:hypothetical protein
MVRAAMRAFSLYVYVAMQVAMIDAAKPAGSATFAVMKLGFPR